MKEESFFSCRPHRILTRPVQSSGRLSSGNGCIIEHHEKRKMLASGRWVIQNPAGTHPGFKINAIYSPFTTWEKMVEAFLAAKDNPRELKTFYNLWLGQAWEERGDAPSWKRLLTLREDYPLGFIPAGALLITVGVDVHTPPPPGHKPRGDKLRFV